MNSLDPNTLRHLSSLLTLTKKELIQRHISVLIQKNTPESPQETATHPVSLTIEVESNEKGYLTKELKKEIALDSLQFQIEIQGQPVAILHDMPTELGLYTWPVVFHNLKTHTIETIGVKVWIVPKQTIPPKPQTISDPKTFIFPEQQIMLG